MAKVKYKILGKEKNGRCSAINWPFTFMRLIHVTLTLAIVAVITIKESGMSLNCP